MAHDVLQSGAGALQSSGYDLQAASRLRCGITPTYRTAIGPERSGTCDRNEGAGAYRPGDTNLRFVGTAARDTLAHDFAPVAGAARRRRASVTFHR